MHFHNRLYVGKKAKRKRRHIMKGLQEGSLLPGTYVITPSLSGNNILDIYPAPVLLLPVYQEIDYLVVGIADNYWEALSVVRDIIDELYQTTGGFDLADFLQKHQ